MSKTETTQTAEPVYMSFRVVETADGAYHATQPGTEDKIVGRGTSEAEAIRNYAEFYEEL